MNVVDFVDALDINIYALHISHSPTFFRVNDSPPNPTPPHPTPARQEGTNALEHTHTEKHAHGGALRRDKPISVMRWWEGQTPAGGFLVLHSSSSSSRIRCVCIINMLPAQNTRRRRRRRRRRRFARSVWLFGCCLLHADKTTTHHARSNTPHTHHTQHTCRRTQNTHPHHTSKRRTTPSCRQTRTTPAHGNRETLARERCVVKTAGATAQSSRNAEKRARARPHSRTVDGILGTRKRQQRVPSPESWRRRRRRQSGGWRSNMESSLVCRVHRSATATHPPALSP